MKMKKLNRKGFTLIELLAVIVILAVVMGIAANSVLSSMNKSRAGALSDSALIVANAFSQKYTEALVDGVPTKVYGDVTGFGGYDFSTTKNYYIDSKLADTFNISASNYAIAGSTGAATAVATSVDQSFVSFNASTGKFVVCLVANKTGSNFVDANKVTADTALSAVKTKSTDPTYNTIKIKSGNMAACSDGTKTW